MQILEGDLCEIGPGVLNAADMDVPRDTLIFSVVSPPAHGVLLNGIYGTDIVAYRQMNAEVLHHSLSVHNFSMDELKQGLYTVCCRCPLLDIQYNYMTVYLLWQVYLSVKVENVVNLHYKKSNTTKRVLCNNNNNNNSNENKLFRNLFIRILFLSLLV